MVTKRQRKSPLPLGSANRATGKSNFCLQLALRVQLPRQCGGIGASALYLTSETSQSAFPSPRLAQLARLVATDAPDASMTEESLLQGVHLGTAATLEALDLVISHHAPRLAVEEAGKGRPRIGLVVIDSLAAPSRADFPTHTLAGLTERARALAILGDRLRQLAHELDLAVVVVNQVADVFRDAEASLPSTPGAEDAPANEAGDATICADELVVSYDSQARLFGGQAPDHGKQAALGLVWANAVDTRLMLSHTGRVHRALLAPTRDVSPMSSSSSPADAAHAAEPITASSLGVRRASLVYSPFAAPASLEYVVEARGLVGIGPVLDLGERWPRSRC